MACRHTALPSAGKRINRGKGLFFFGFLFVWFFVFFLFFSFSCQTCLKFGRRSKNMSARDRPEVLQCLPKTSKALESPGSVSGDFRGIWILLGCLVCGEDHCCRVPCLAASAVLSCPTLGYATDRFSAPARVEEH